MNCWEEYRCKYWNNETELCGFRLGVDRGGCPMEGDMESAFGTPYEDPLDKAATDITPYDVYSQSELL